MLALSEAMESVNELFQLNEFWTDFNTIPVTADT